MVETNGFLVQKHLKILQHIYITQMCRGYFSCTKMNNKQYQYEYDIISMNGSQYLSGAQWDICVRIFTKIYNFVIFCHIVMKFGTHEL